MAVPSTRTFVDGDYANSPFTDGPRHGAIYANHCSARPNAKFEKFPVPSPSPFDLRHRMLLVSTERIPAGGEIRVDYEAGGSKYWPKRPAESSWRAVRLPPPPPSGVEAVPGSREHIPSAEARPSAARGAPLDALAWEAARGGDARLQVLVPLLKAEQNPSNWSLVATHIFGRSARACRNRFGGGEGLEPPPSKRASRDAAAEGVFGVGAGPVRPARRKLDAVEQEERPPPKRARPAIPPVAMSPQPPPQARAVSPAAASHVGGYMPSAQEEREELMRLRELSATRATAPAPAPVLDEGPADEPMPDTSADMESVAPLDELPLFEDEPPPPAALPAPMTAMIGIGRMPMPFPQAYEPVPTVLGFPLMHRALPAQAPGTLQLMAAGAAQPSGAGAVGGEMQLLMHHLLSQQQGGHLSPHLNGASTSSQMHPLAPPPARACGVTGGGRTRLRELREQVQPSGSRSRLQHLPGGYRPMPVAPSPASAPAAMTIAGSVVEIDEID